MDDEKSNDSWESIQKRPKLVSLDVGTWFPWFQGHPLISGAMPLESGAGFA